MGKPLVKMSGARGWIFCRAASFLVLAALLCCGAARAGIRPLVERASLPEVMFGAPREYDSLLARIADGGESSARELLEYADTPWGWRFEVVRRGLERIGEPARKVILENLMAGDAAEGETVRNLVLLEKLGHSGDEAALAVYLKHGDSNGRITALRCLASFGEPEGSLKLALPLLGADDEKTRLAAVWTVGELWKKCGFRNLKSDIEASLQALTGDPVLQVRLTAAEILEAAGEGRTTGPRKDQERH